MTFLKTKPKGAAALLINCPYAICKASKLYHTHIHSYLDSRKLWNSCTPLKTYVYSNYTSIQSETLKELKSPTWQRALVSHCFAAITFRTQKKKNNINRTEKAVGRYNFSLDLTMFLTSRQQFSRSLDIVS